MSHQSDCNEKKFEVHHSECKSCEQTCLERPRYFCGQLLTDEDLNAEQRYQREKNKLHNRYLHGWGVVCGLKVTCHPKCGSKGHVLIENGYAIDCCGNDIVVCNNETPDIIKLIKRGKPKPETDDCADEITEKNDGCEDLENKYCLIIRYDENESHPVTALKKDDGGCTVKRCEPSRIKEGYTFEVKKCKDCNGFDKGQYSKGAWGTIQQCFSVLQKAPLNGYIATASKIISPSPAEAGVPVDPQSRKSYFNAYCGIKKYLLDTIKTGSVRCEMKEKLSDIVFPDYSPQNAAVATGATAFTAGNTGAYGTELKQTFSRLVGLLHQQILDCICLQLLYPCPECREDDKVVLACITVQGDKIKKICNLSRRDVMTFPKLFHWLPIDEMVRKMIVQLCCELTLDSLPEFTAGMNQGLIAMPRTLEMYSEVSRSSLNSVSENFSNALKTPGGISAGLLYGEEFSAAKNTLEKDNITVKKIDFKPELLSLKEILYPPSVLQPDSTVDMFVKDEKVMYVRAHEEVKAVDIAAIQNLTEKYDVLRSEFNAVKSSMRRDLGSTIKLKANIEEAYQPLTIDLVKSLTENMKPEAIKEVGNVREKELKKAGIKSVRTLLEAVPAEVSNATKEPIANATKYVDHAENLALMVTAAVYNELKRAGIKKKKDLNKADTKALSKKLNMPKRVVEKVFNDILKTK